jgi:adenine C2-methylase RlmN of 23S rRNA A2503 and tRNA A37
MNKTDLTDFSLSQLTDFVESLGLPTYRSNQIFAWLYRPNITDFSQMTDLTKDLRETLATQASFDWPEVLSNTDLSLRAIIILNQSLSLKTAEIPCVFLLRWVVRWVASFV